jgi:hypothetical protein
LEICQQPKEIAQWDHGRIMTIRRAIYNKLELNSEIHQQPKVMAHWEHGRIMTIRRGIDNKLEMTV